METRKKRCLPEALDASGRWTAERRSEVLALFQNHVYGTLPQTGFSVRGCVTRTESLAGLGHKEIVHLTISTPGGDYSYPFTCISRKAHPHRIPFRLRFTLATVLTRTA